MCLQLESWKLARKPMNQSRSLIIGDKLCNFWNVEIIEFLEIEFRTLKSLNNRQRTNRARKLSQRSIRQPHSLFHHLTHIQRHFRDCGPSVFQTHLKESAENSSCRLSNVDHIGENGESFEFDTRDIGLEENVDFGSWFIDTFLDGDRNHFFDFSQLHFLVRSDWDVAEFLAEGEDAEHIDVGDRFVEEISVGFHRVV